MPEKDGNLWTALAGSLAAIGAAIRYYWTNMKRIRDRDYWRDAGIDLIGSVFIGIMAFLVSEPFLGATASAGVGGACGHIGTRQMILMINKWLERK